MEVLPPIEIELRTFADGFDELLYKLYYESCSGQLDLVGWDGPQKHAFVRMQFDLRRRAYQMQFPAAVDHIIFADGVAAGRLLILKCLTESRVVDIAVLTEHQGRGIASAVLARLRDEVPRLVLRVDKSNLAAISVYTKAGFVVDAESELLLEMSV